MSKKVNLTALLHGKKSEHAPLSQEALKCYATDLVTGEYKGITYADESPREPGVILVPAGAIFSPPPHNLLPGLVWCWDGTMWVEIEDHRGEVWFDIEGGRHEILSIGWIDPKWTQTDVADQLAYMNEEMAIAEAIAERKRLAAEAEANRDPMDFIVANHALRAVMSRAGFADDYIDGRVSQHEIRFWWRTNPSLYWFDDMTQAVLRQCSEISSNRWKELFRAAKDYGVAQ